MPLDVLRARQNVKWAKYGADVLPAWVAEMDFSVAYPIRRAMDRLVQAQEYGYPQRDGRSADDAVATAFAARMQSRFGWSVDTDLVQPLSDLVQGTFASIWAYSNPGDKVILQLPAYPPFHESISATGRRLVPHPLKSDGTRYTLDIEGLEALVDTQTRMILLCNPQNPTGRVFDRAELTEIGRIAIERDLVIVADEIHCDLVYPGRQHIPIASISPEIAARTVTITSPTKSFNIPGLRCGVLHFGTRALRDRFHARVPARMLGSPSIAGIDATVAAWTHGQPWLDEVLVHLDANRQRLAGFLASELPAIRLHVPEATYLAWLDCSALGLETSAFDFFHDRAKVAFSPGEAFDPACRSFIRFNFATSSRILDEILGRMADAARSAGRG
nr:PatB family C-S lyase [Limobrevibacterium gyesilva]